MDKATIAAVATPFGHGGIGIIKISGNKAIPIAGELFHPFGKSLDSGNPHGHLKTFLPHTRGFYFGSIISPDTGRIIDEVMLLVMPAPKSYTREDVVEIHTHGGVAAVNTVLNLVLDAGARPAGPGEFTKRAFLNGRIDLTQAEAVMDVVNAGSAQSLSLAANLLSGVFGKSIENATRVVEDLVIKIEAAIDFPEDVEEGFFTEGDPDLLQIQALSVIEGFIKQHENTRLLKEGLTVVIAGRPNVGKSSLMNCLLNKERVIVSGIPGTTRDFIQESRLVENAQVLFTDTAGIQESADDIEQMGITKTFAVIKDADLVLYVVDMEQGIHPEDIEIFTKIAHGNTLLVLNKKDRVAPGYRMDIPPGMRNVTNVDISAKYHLGIDVLEREILNVAGQCKPDFTDSLSVSPNLRHYHMLKQAKKSLITGMEGIQGGLPMDLCVIDLKEAVEALNEILGKNIKTDLLDKIFERFCIGK